MDSEINTKRAVGFITEKARVQMIPEDLLIAEALKERGVSVFPIPWEEADVGLLSKLDLVVFRTPWNYYRELPKFLEWLKRLEALKVQVHNPLPIIYWNLDKSYLRELESRGATVVPTRFFKTSEFKVDMEWPETQTGGFVIKPAISASADRTFKGDRPFLTDIIMEENVFRPNESLMLQPFVDTITTEGEYSFIYFGGEFSHAVVKKPKAHDFRVQNEHGGSWDYFVPSGTQVEQADAIMKAFGNSPLYARVDMVNFSGRLHLMELELFEPMLYIKDIELARSFAARFPL